MTIAVAGVAVALIVLIVAGVLVLRGVSGGGKSGGSGGKTANDEEKAKVLYVIGEDIAPEDVTGLEYEYEFMSMHYEKDSYTFSAGDDGYVYHSDSRSGDPVDLKMTEEEWSRFLECIDGGQILDRDKTYSTGEPSKKGVADSGWTRLDTLCLSWNGQEEDTKELRFEFAGRKRRDMMEELRRDLEEQAMTDGNGTGHQPVQDEELLEIPFESVWAGTYEIRDFRGASQPVLWDGLPVPLEGEAVVFFGLNEGDKVIGITIVDENDPDAVSPFMIARAAVRPDGSLMPVVDENESIENNLLYDRKMTEEEAEGYVIYRDSAGVHFELDYDDGTVSFYATFLLTEEIYSE